MFAGLRRYVHAAANHSSCDDHEIDSRMGNRYRSSLEPLQVIARRTNCVSRRGSMTERLLIDREHDLSDVVPTLELFLGGGDVL